MMVERRSWVAPGMAQKKELLHVVYDVYSGWIKRFPLACRKGCSACCTRSVTMSSLEGRQILDFARKNNREKWLHEKLALAAPGTGRAAMTMNRFARACLEQRQAEGDSSGSWDFTPCIFLEHNTCTLYEVRPFGCRSFGSLTRCTPGRAAEIVPVHLAVNTVFTQVIEHLSSDGGYWANMADILESLLDEKDPGASGKLLSAQPIPGFLLEPHEVKLVDVLLRQLMEQSAAKRTFGDLIDNFILIE